MTTNIDFADSSIHKSYRRLRALASGALIVLPLLTALSAFFIGSHRLQPSLSDYYFVVEDGGLPRTIFVIFLAFLGGVLLSYRGLDENDNKIHNWAGLFSFGVALFPMSCDTAVHAYCVPGLYPIFHVPSASLLYISAVISVIYGGGPKLRAALTKLPNPKVWQARLKNIRLLSAALMTVGIIAFLIHAVLPTLFSGFSFIFWIEYGGFFGFGLYWFRLMRFIDDANEEGRKLSLSNSPQLSAEQKIAPLNSPTRVSAIHDGEQWVEIP